MKKRWRSAVSILLVLTLFMSTGMSVLASEATTETTQKTEEQKKAEEAKKKKYEEDKAQIVSNKWENWPEGPVAGAGAAIVMEVSTGTILYEKNIDKHMYPASITKVLTALLAVENGQLTDPVKITKDCVSFLQWDESQIGLKEGNEITLEQALYATLLASANEAAYAVGKNVGVNAGHDYDWFIEQMNVRVQELGGNNSHFANTNGLHDDNHYTCARDMALIGREIFKHPEIFQIMQTLNYTIPKSDTVEEHAFHQKHRMLKKGKYHYEYAVGGKTGRTQKAGSTLITMADNGELQLVAVVLNAQGVEVYKDTKAMFDYAFENFKKVEVSGTEQVDGYEQILPAAETAETNPNASGYVIVPNTVSYEQLEKTETPIEGTNQVLLSYSISGQNVGSAVALTKQEETSEEKGIISETEEEEEVKEGIIYNTIQLLRKAVHFVNDDYSEKGTVEKYETLAFIAVLPVLTIVFIVIMITKLIGYLKNKKEDEE